MIPDPTLVAIEEQAAMAHLLVAVMAEILGETAPAHAGTLMLAALSAAGLDLAPTTGQSRRAFLDAIHGRGAPAE